MFRSSINRVLLSSRVAGPRNVGLSTSIRAYSSKRREEAPKLRYLFYMFLVSTGVLYLAGKAVDQRKKPQNSFTDERELKEYEQVTGLKRRHKLISYEKNENYKFYVLPYVHAQSTVERLAAKLKQIDGDKPVRIIDPVALIEAEKADESKKYSFLLQDLERSQRPLPKGLVTAIIKEEIQFFLNTRSGTFDTNFIIANYPQTTEEAIKFENDISDVQKCLVFHYDKLNELPKEADPNLERSVNNVIGYFETVGKTKEIVSRHDELDDELKDIILEDL